MNLNTILLTCAALFPAIALCIYVFRKDRVEKEPLGLLLLLLAMGALSCYPAGELEEILINGIRKFFLNFGRESNGTLYLPTRIFKLYNGLVYFVGVGLVEEALKFVVLLLFTRKNKNFNSLFDGLIYSVFVSLGFAALENVMYVTRYGWLNAFTRAVMSVPAHMFFSVLMGYYYSLWHMYAMARTQERKLKAQGLILPQTKEYPVGRYLVLSLLMPVLAHGWYDYCCTVGTKLGTVMLYFFLLFLYIYCFGKIGKLSQGDMRDSAYSTVLVVRKYPHLADYLAQTVIPAAVACPEGQPEKPSDAQPE